MALGAWRHGGVAGVDGVQRAAELADQGLHQESRGGDAPHIGRPGCGARDGLEALVQDVAVAHMRGAEAALAGGAARALDGFEGRPWGEAVADAGGVLVVNPWEDLGAVVFSGTGEAMRETHVVADQTAARCDEWFEGTHGGAWGGEGRELVARREPALTLECRVRGIVLGVAGRAGVAGLGQGQRLAGAQDPQVVLTQGGDERACIACEAHGHRASCEPLSSGPCPLSEGLWCVLKNHELPCVVADGLSADLVCGIGPIDANAGGTRCVW
jgi:hypothetical protein